MPPINVAYNTRTNWSSGTNNYSKLPYCEITLFHSDPNSNASTNEWGLIDTGATRLVLPYHLAQPTLGIDLSKCTGRKVATASGGTWMFESTLDISIRGSNPVNVPIFFSPSCTILVGLSAILATMGFGVDNSGWLHL